MYKKLQLISSETMEGHKMDVDFSFTHLHVIWSISKYVFLLFIFINKILFQEKKIKNNVCPYIKDSVSFGENLINLGDVLIKSFHVSRSNLLGYPETHRFQVICQDAMYMYV